MTSEEKLNKKLTKYVENIEKKHGDYVDFVLHENFVVKRHMMYVEGVDLSEIYSQLKDLEKADLIDFFKQGI